MAPLEFSDYIAALSLLVAIISARKSFISNKRVKELDLQLKELELQEHKLNKEDSKKADIEVDVISAPHYGSKLRFHNKGLACATNISFTIPSDVKEKEIALIMQPDYLPYPKLHPFQEFEVSYDNYGTKPHQTIHITWDDDFGIGRSKEMVVDM